MEKALGQIDDALNGVDADKTMKAKVCIDMPPRRTTDAQGQQTKAVLDGDEWVLNGSKVFITNGKEADIYVIIAVTGVVEAVSYTHLDVYKRQPPISAMVGLLPSTIMSTLEI